MIAGLIITAVVLFALGTFMGVCIGKCRMRHIIDKNAFLSVGTKVEIKNNFADEGFSGFIWGYFAFFILFINIACAVNAPDYFINQVRKGERVSEIQTFTTKVIYKDGEPSDTTYIVNDIHTIKK